MKIESIFILDIIFRYFAFLFPYTAINSYTSIYRWTLQKQFTCSPDGLIQTTQLWA